MIARLLGYQVNMGAYLIFFGSQIAAFVLGIVSRKKRLGKAASVTSVVLALGSPAFLAYDRANCPLRNSAMVYLVR